MKLKIINILPFLLLIIIFLNYEIILSSTITAFNLWLNKVFPFLFIMFIFNDLLLSLNINQLFKSNALYVYIMSLLSGSPTSAFIIGNLYKSKHINKNNANYYLTFSFFVNPLFLYTILKSIFNNIIAIKLILIHYISNIIVFYIFKKNITPENITLKNNPFNLGNSIKKSMNNLLMILGTIVLFLIISNILSNILNLNNLFNVLLKGILELTQGLVFLSQIKINTKIKEIIALAFISFGGLSIHSQIKSLLDEYNLEYKYFIKGRLYQLLISLTIQLSPVHLIVELFK